MKNNRNEESTNNQGDKAMEKTKNNINEPRMDGAKPRRDNAALFCALGLAGGGVLAWAIISAIMPAPKVTLQLDVMTYHDWLYAQPFWLRTAIRAGLLTWVALLLHFGAALFSQLIVSRRKKWATSIKANAVCRLGYMSVQAIALALGLWLCPTIFPPMTTRKYVIIFGTILATMAIEALLLRRRMATVNSSNPVAMG